MPGWIVQLLYGLVSSIIGKITPEMLAALREQAKLFAIRARETGNPWDDIVANFMLLVLGVSKNGGQ